MADNKETKIAEKVVETTAAASGLKMSPEMMELMKQLIPAVAVALEQGRKMAQDKVDVEQMEARIREESRQERCSECGQKRGGCKDEHVQMVVLPMQQDFADWFEGAFINGVRYLSSHGGHKITVPKSAEGGIARTIADFEDNEKHLRTPRKKMKYEPIGNVGPGGAQSYVNPNNIAQGWR